MSFPVSQFGRGGGVGGGKGIKNNTKCLAIMLQLQIITARTKTFMKGMFNVYEMQG